MKEIKRKPPKLVSDLRDLVKTSADKFGDRVLYEYKHRTDKSERTITYSEFYHDMNALGTALANRGFAGASAALIGDTDPYLVMSYLAAVNGNGVAVPLDRELSADAVADFTTLAECKLIVYTQALAETVRSLRDRLPSVELYVELFESNDKPPELPVVTIGTLIAEGAKLLESGDISYTSIELDTEKNCAVIFTSGTTGTSKGVMLSQSNLTSAVNAASLAVPYDEDTRLLSMLPLNHTYEMTCTELGGINLGCRICINPSLKYAARSMQKYKPTAMILVPLFVETVYKKIKAGIEEGGKSQKVNAALKLSRFLMALGIDIRRKLFSEVISAFGGELVSIICGGAPVRDDILKELYDFGIVVFEGYGITECAPLVAVNPNGKARFGSVGLPVRDCEVKILDPGSDGKGEILVKGKNVMLGYYRNEEATREAFTEDGWFRTGDIGYIDRDGYIYITGRKKNVIILSNGKNVYPEELEEKLSVCRYVKEMVVVGRKNEDGRETSVAAIIFPDYDSFSDLTHDEIKQRALAELNELNEKQPPSKQVSVFEFRETEFEKTTTKKIKRFLVK